MSLIDDLATAYAVALTCGLAVQAFYGQESDAVFFDAPDEEVFGGVGQGAEYKIRFQTSSFVTLGPDQSLVIATHVYRVREIRAINDGLEKMAWLQRTA